MKIKRIKRLVESLNNRELLQLSSLLETIDTSSLTVEEIVTEIVHEDLEITDDLLKRSEKNGYSVAHHLANIHTIIKWYPTNKEILKLKTDYNLTVAHCLAQVGTEEGWNNSR